jgi:hypothetical protein
MVRTLSEEIGGRKQSSLTKETILKLMTPYHHPFSAEMMYEFFDVRVWDVVKVLDSKVTDDGVTLPNKVYINGGPYPFPEDISDFVSACNLEGVLSRFDWNVEIKIKYGFL